MPKSLNNLSTFYAMQLAIDNAHKARKKRRKHNIKKRRPVSKLRTEEINDEMKSVMGQ
ncbi:MAG: hypothetical protein V1707_02375 [bacterium]